MPVLLLAQGDEAAKDTLRRAIEARYGTRPLALDSLQVDFNGRARVKLGPTHAWVPLEMRTYFVFPNALRLDFVVKPLKMPVQRGVEAFDGETYRTVRGNKQPVVVDDREHVNSVQRRLWAMASIMLTPLSDMFVKLEANGDDSLLATNTRLQDAAEIKLRPDATVEYVRVHCLNPESGQHQDYSIYLSEEVVDLDELIIPSSLMMYWDDVHSFEAQPVAVQINPHIPDAVFRIEQG